MDTSKGEGKRLLRTLELKAFRSVVDALRAQGSFTTQKRKVLKSVASALKVGDERCRSEMRRAVSDNLLNYIAQCSEEQNSDQNWCLDSARKIARVPMITEPTAFTALADKVSDWVVSQVQKPVDNDFTLMDILESKKCRTDANASTYHTTKLFAPMLSTQSRNIDINVELEKLISLAKESNNNLQRSKIECMPAAKSKEILVQNENPSVAYRVVENNIRNRIPSDDEVSIHASVGSVSPKRDPEIKPIVPNKTRSSRSRTKPSKRCAPSSKLSSLQEELGRTVDAMDSFSISATEQTNGCKPQSDTILENADLNDDWQPKKKKVRSDDAVKRVSFDDVDKKRSLVAKEDENKSSAVPEAIENRVTNDNAFVVNDSTNDGSQEALSDSSKSSFAQVQEDSSVSVEKDFTPHTFNLIPASRRLKMVKKNEIFTLASTSRKQERTAVANNDEFLVPGGSENLALKNRELMNTNFGKNSPNFGINSQSKNASLVAVGNAEKSERKQPVVLSTLAIKSQIKKSVSDVITSEAASIEPKTGQEKPTGEKLKNMQPVINRTKTTLSLLGNIKVRNLNANTEEESLEQDALTNSHYEDDREKGGAENEDEVDESDVDMSEIDTSSIAGETSEGEYSTFDESDSQSIIEYWDHDDEDGENGVKDVECADSNKRNGYENGISLDENNADSGDADQSHAGMPCDRISGGSDFNDEEIVEEIFEEDEEFLSDDDEDTYEKAVNTKISLPSQAQPLNPSICDEGKSVDKNERIVSVNSAVIVDQRTEVKPENPPPIMADHKKQPAQETSPAPKTDAATTKASAVSIVKLRKPLTVGPTPAAATVRKEVLLVSSRAAPPKPALVRSSSSADTAKLSSSPLTASANKLHTITPSKCIVGGQTISLSNARLIGAALPTAKGTGGTPTLASTKRPPNANVDFPKITVYSSTRIPSSGAGTPGGATSLYAPLSASSKSILLSQSAAKGAAAVLAPVRRDLAKSTSLPVRQKVCRLYDLMEVSESALSGSKCKKNQLNKKAAVVNVSSS